MTKPSSQNANDKHGKGKDQPVLPPAETDRLHPDNMHTEETHE
jgi:hypothetical protein